MSVVIDGTNGITHTGNYTANGISFPSNTPSNTMMSTSLGAVGIGVSPATNIKLDIDGTVRAKGYTVATLPTGVVGARAYVTDAVTAVFMAIPAGGGSVKTPVFYNGSNWVCG